MADEIHEAYIEYADRYDDWVDIYTHSPFEMEDLRAAAVALEKVLGEGRVRIVVKQRISHG